MTQIVATVASDRIILLTDGKATNTSNTLLSARKIFAATDNIAVAITGHVQHFLPGVIDELPGHLTSDGVESYSDIVAYIDNFVQEFDWQFKGNESICFVIAGYEEDGPKVGIITYKQEPSINPIAIAAGSWKGDLSYLMNNLPNRPTSQLEFREAERISIRLLATAEINEPSKIGGEATMWHIYPDRTEIKTSSYTQRLRKVHCKNL